MRCVLLSVIVCAACAKVDKPEFPPASFTVIQQEDTSITVTGDLFTMHFPGNIGQDVPSMHFPDSLTVGGVNVLGPVGGCADEQQVGLAMFPAFVTSPKIATEPTFLTLPPGDDLDERNGITVNAEGPHVVQVGIRYTVDYTCSPGNAPERFQGRTAFTFFPSGRIVRHDFDIRPSTNALMAQGQACGCAAMAGGPLAFTSFWTFNPSGGRMVQRNGTPLTFQPPPNANSIQSGPFDGLCAMYAPHAIGVSYGGEGISRARNNQVNLAAVFDFNFDDSLAPVVMEGDTDDQDVLYDITSAIQIVPQAGLADGQCGPQVLELLTEPGIEVDSVPFDSADADGIYNDFLVHEDDFEIRVPVEPMPPGWAFRTIIPGGVAKVVRDPDLGRTPALVQRDSTEEDIFLFYFPDGLAPGETITIEVL